MKRKDLLLLTLLLTQTTPVWAMLEENEGGNLPVQNRAQHEHNVRDRHYVLAMEEERNGNPHLAQHHYEEAFQFAEPEAEAPFHNQGQRMRRNPGVAEDVRDRNDPPRAEARQQQRAGNRHVDVDRLQENIQRTEEVTRQRLERYNNNPYSNNKVIVVGYSANGKTSLIEGLAGNLIARDERGEIQLHSRRPLEDFRIGGGIGEAGTTIPGGWYDAQRSGNKIFWDCPGFGDPGVNGEDIINASAIRQLFPQNSQANLLLAIDEGSVLYEAQPIKLQKLFNELAAIFPDTEQLKNSLSVVITKKMPGRNPLAKLQDLQARGNLQILTPAGRELFDFITDPEYLQTRLAYFPAPLEAGDYVLNREAIFNAIARTVPVQNPVIRPYLNDTSQLLITNAARQLNADAADFLRVEGAQRIAEFCNNADPHSIETLRETLPAVVASLRLLQQDTATAGDFVATLGHYFLHVNPLREIKEKLEFLGGIKDDITCALPVWSQVLTPLINDVTARITNLATQRNQQTTDFLQTQGAQSILDYCKNEINNHQGSVGALRTNLGNVLRDLRSLQNPERPASAETFLNTLRPYLNQQGFLGDTINAFNSLRRMNMGNNIICNIPDWSAALEETSRKLEALTAAPEIAYDPLTKVLSLKGIIVGTSDLAAMLQLHPNPVKIDVSALHTLFVDENLIAPGTSCSFIAPQWVVDGEKIINLSGKDGELMNPAANGGVGQAGTDGQPGNSGKNGGNFYSKVTNIQYVNRPQEASPLTINTSGGQGGNGQDGGRGGEGMAGQNESYPAAPNFLAPQFLQQPHIFIPKSSFALGGQAPYRIGKIVIYSGDRPDSIEIFGRAGANEFFSLGKAGGPSGARHEIILESDEFLTGAVGKDDPWSGPQCISFVTNKRTHGPYGRDDNGYPFATHVPQEVIGISGSHGPNRTYPHVLNSLFSFTSGHALPSQVATNGGAGKNGGAGGQAGLGGYAGMIEGLPNDQLIVRHAHRGENGQDGRGRDGGPGGVHGRFHNGPDRGRNPQNGARGGLNVEGREDPLAQLTQMQLDLVQANQVQDYRNFHQLKSNDPIVSPFVKLFPNL